MDVTEQKSFLSPIAPSQARPEPQSAYQGRLTESKAACLFIGPLKLETLTKHVGRPPKSNDIEALQHFHIPFRPCLNNQQQHA